MNTQEFKQLNTEEQINVVNALEVFQITEKHNYIKNGFDYATEQSVTEYYHDVKLVGVVSKITFKQILEVRVYNKFFNKNSFFVNSNNFVNLFEMSVKTQKYSQEKLKIILENRMEGLYKYKNQLGQTWNQGGIN